MANTYTYTGPGTRWAEGNPTAEDLLNISRINNDHVYEALNTIMSSSAAAGLLAVAAGAVGAPSITKTGDSNTGVWFPAADTIALSTAGVERWRVDSAGDVGFGTTNPTHRLHVSEATDAAAAYIVGQSTGGNPVLEVENGAGNAHLRIDCDSGSGDSWDLVSDTAGNFSIFNPEVGAAGITMMTITPAGLVGIGETLNGNMTVGLTINQGTADNEILALKSTTDVAHPFTSMAEGDTWGTIQKVQSTSGGMDLRGWKDASGDEGYAIRVKGYLGEAANSNKNTVSEAVVMLDAAVTNGSDAAAGVAAEGNLVAICNNTTLRFIFDADGDSHQDVGTAWTNFDNEPDAMIARSVGIVMDPSSIVRSEFDDWSRDHKEELIRTGLIPRVSQEDEAKGVRPLMNTTQLARLHNGAIWQNHVALQETKAVIAEQAQELLELKKELFLLKENN